MKPDFGVIRGMVERPVARFADVKDGAIDFAGVRLPVRPMVGVIATAPDGEPVGTAYVGRHGGNLDCNLIAEGATVHLPVRVPGALFYIGDVHAVMGDGEVSGSGFEIAARITVRLSLRKGGATEWPWLETADTIATLASAPKFDDAAEAAVRAMIPLLMARHGVSETDAYMLCFDPRRPPRQPGLPLADRHERPVRVSEGVRGGRVAATPAGGHSASSDVTFGGSPCFALTKLRTSRMLRW